MHGSPRTRDSSAHPTHPENPRQRGNPAGTRRGPRQRTIRPDKQARRRVKPAAQGFLGRVRPDVTGGKWRRIGGVHVIEYALMSESVEVAPVPTRFPADAALVRRLIRAQFPQWADLPIRRVDNEGWDNQTFHLGTQMSVRLPSAAPYALAVDKEHRWLPVLAPRLPVSVPIPLAKGEPDSDYPHHWSVYRWLPGEPAGSDNIADMSRFAIGLAEFLIALQRVDAASGPGPGEHNWYRGGPLRTYDRDVRQALSRLDGRLETDLVRDVWRCALEASWDGVPVWFHGDVAQGNLLVQDGALAAVIDFGTCGVGDPACDLAIAWTLFRDESRHAFRRTIAPDSGTWARGRGWALWKALVGFAGAIDANEPGADEKNIIDEILADYAQAW